MKMKMESDVVLRKEELRMSNVWPDPVFFIKLANFQSGRHRLAYAYLLTHSGIAEKVPSLRAF